MKPESPTKTAAIIAGHGSILSDAGGAMVRIAEQLREQAIVPIVEAGFLNYNRPTFADALTSALTQGATRILVLPYFLIAGSYVCNDLQKMVENARISYPQISFTVTEVLGLHPLLVELATQRLQTLLAEDISLASEQSNRRRALLFVAHGTSLEAANLPIVQVLRQVQSELGYHDAALGFLDCNQPDIPSAFDQLVATGIAQIDVLPYFLHLGRHVRKDLPAHFAAARQRHDGIAIRIARHLDDETLLARICSERISENCELQTIDFGE